MEGKRDDCFCDSVAPNVLSSHPNVLGSSTGGLCSIFMWSGWVGAGVV